MGEADDDGGGWISMEKAVVELREALARAHQEARIAVGMYNELHASSERQDGRMRELIAENTRLQAVADLVDLDRVKRERAKLDAARAMLADAASYLRQSEPPLAAAIDRLLLAP